MKTAASRRPAQRRSSSPRRAFAGDYITQIAMPMGGIGAGCICLNGFGGLQDYSIRNRPETTALPDGHYSCHAAFALLHIRGRRPQTRLVEGPFPLGRIYDQGLQGQGYRKGGHEGLPRFENCRFRAEYPFGHVDLDDSEIPLAVTLTGFSPLIPLDDKNSGLPCAILEYTLRNTSRQPVDFEFSYHLSHLAIGSKGEEGTRNVAIPGAGVYFSNTEHPHHESFGSASLSVVGHDPVIKAMWLRGFAWRYESITALWREVSEARLVPNESSGDLDRPGRNGGSVLLRGRLKPGESVTYPIVITWYFPNVKDKHGQPAGAPACCPGGTCTPDKSAQPTLAWRPWYVSQWSDARDVARYVRENYATLHARTLAFKHALLSSTLPPEVLDAVSSNLAILKSPTVLRQDNGNMWAWEGCHSTAGCCHGSCTHVWNYAQALPHLFPALERTLREQELLRSIDERGHVTFRAALPDGPAANDFHAAADGQLGGIMKLYRDWQISGDTAWLRTLYPNAKMSLDYCIAAWDPARKGAIFEPHHNTYDIEFWGPDGMCTSVYVGALSALAEMAEALDYPDDVRSYGALAKRAAKYMDQHLFNGEYYQQNVMWKGLKNNTFPEQLKKGQEGGEDFVRILSSEGPCYQYGAGCLADGVIGAWMARIYGIATPLSAQHVRQTLRAIFRHNFRADLFRHACLQRPGYAMGHEPGLILCTWPRGKRPTIPFIYSDEVWTGIEYQVASHLIAEGLVQEGLAIVAAARARYDGRVRNPFNEYECGNYYARALSSYALLGALSGFRYSGVERALYFAPRLKTETFRTFFSTATAFGTITLSRNQLVINVLEGRLPIERVYLHGRTTPIVWSITADPAEPAVLRLAGKARS